MSHRHGGEPDTDAEPNHRFLIEALRGGLLGAPERVLDFGCGRGALVRMASQAGIDMHGADTFDGLYEQWRAETAPEIAARVHAIEQGRLPFADASFDAVVSNQVFEHIADPRPALTEIARVLKPGGMFLALFPTRETWFEGHVGVYFAHWLNGAPALQRAWLRTAHALGLGYWRTGLSRDDWAQASSSTLHASVFYHDMPSVRRWWREAFGAAPRSASADLMLFRMRASRRLRTLAPLASGARPLLAAACHARAGRVLMTQNCAVAVAAGG